MTSSTYNISDEQRETCAVNVMRAMLEDYCTETGVPFNQALSFRALLLIRNCSITPLVFGWRARIISAMSLKILASPPILLLHRSSA